jgi:hypothetical protein
VNEQALLERIRRLPPDKRQAVEDFIEEMERRTSSAKQRRSLMGALAHLNIHITEQDIEEARREMRGRLSTQ